RAHVGHLFDWVRSVVDLASWNCTIYAMQLRSGVTRSEPGSLRFENRRGAGLVRRRRLRAPEDRDAWEGHSKHLKSITLGLPRGASAAAAGDPPAVGMLLASISRIRRARL